MWYACQSKVLTRSSCLVATSEAEYEDIRRLKLRNPIAIVPHSYDLPEVFDHLVLDGRRRVLYLGRIHPIKGLHNLVEAWAKIENRFPEWELHMVGPGLPKHVEDLQGLIKSKGLTRAVLRDGVYGEEKAREYRQAELFVLTSFSENFAMTVAESLGYQVPAIVSKGAPWKGIEEHQCGWWIDIGVDPLVNALEVACSRSPAHLGAMGKLGRTWVGDEFHWRKLANQMRDVYAWVLGDGPIPDAVRTD